MTTHKVGIIMNGVTGRMGTNQHLLRSIKAIIDQGGVRLSDSERILPDPILVGRSEAKLAALAARAGISRYTTDLDTALADAGNQIYFDATLTGQRPHGVRKAIAARKHIYCEKPTATTSAEALALAQEVEAAGLKNGVVQDKLWLPGLLKLKYLIDTGFFGRILSVRGEFGYWVFTGEHEALQRPSWNYRKEEDGGIIVDMLCHWQYVIQNLFGEIQSLSCLGATHIPQRWDEAGQPYKCTADDAAYATFQLANGTICHFNSSWCVRVDRDDLLTLQVDGTHGSAVAGLRDCKAQPLAATPRAVWNPDIDSPIDYKAGWSRVPTNAVYDNAFKVQWELFLRHVVKDEPFRWSLREGAKGVQLAELGLKSWAERRWVDVEAC
ncbi:oxidoreductase [Cephaloticoccus capnophilus]|uniref:Oxidoreductase n=1 Tax=Cephaloticoccus capnophilus TaxID=1548208 RepID=A0A139SNC3_9BACT|nr:Gfo/Idh/MocA family oxidoreductase [Cephaloticoccus capnophilus]KXU36088.1 oxidoreductase [Cephaloticoccus capnophilus]